MLNLKNIDVFYNNIKAINNISFEVNKGEIVTLIGANGAGKTTTLKTISGIISPKNGEISFLNESIISIPPHKIVKIGIVQVPEGRRIFSNLTVLENLQMGAYTRNNKKEIRDNYEMVFTRFPRLKERINQIAGTLSGGEQQMLAMGRTLMASPLLLLLDEPSMGLSPILVEEIFEIIKEINNSGTTILLVEQNARMALSVAHRAYVMETGNIKLSGNPEELLKSEEIKKAYLG